LIHPHHGAPREGLLHNPVVHTGLGTGVLLSLVMLAALVLANRMPRFELFALERNAICSGIFVLVALWPVVHFWRSPVKLFTSGIISWIVFTLAYEAAGNFFANLHSQLRTPGVVLAYGAAGYGLIAVLCWVGDMLHSAAHHAPLRAHRRPPAHRLQHHQ
jgi:hypothetical protein